MCLCGMLQCILMVLRLYCTPGFEMVAFQISQSSQCTFVHMCYQHTYILLWFAAKCFTMVIFPKELMSEHIFARALLLS